MTLDLDRLADANEHVVELRADLAESRAAIDRITRKWARASFDETIIAPLVEIEEERREFGLPPFTDAEIAEFNP